MAVYVWQQDLEPDFPLAVLEYAAHGDGDPMHWHDHLEIALVLEGRGAFMFGRRALPAERRRHLLHRQLAAARRARGPGDVAPPAPRPVPAGADRRPGLPGAGPRLPGAVPGGRADRVAADPRDVGRSPRRWPRSCTSSATTWERHDPAERHLVDATLRLALGAREPASPAPRSGAAAARAAADRREQIRPVLAYVDRHCRESITLDDVAEVVHVSPSRVRHVFKDVTGVSFKEYVTQVRVAEAKRLLLGTDLSVAEIARGGQLHEPEPVLQGLLPLLRDVAGRVPPLLHARPAARPCSPRCDRRACSCRSSGGVVLRARRDPRVS